MCGLFILVILASLFFPTTTHAQAAFSLAYVNDAQEVILLNPASGEQRVVLTLQPTTSNLTTYGLHPSPDGQFLAVYQQVFDPATINEASIKPIYKLYVVRLADGQLVLQQNLVAEDYTFPGIDLGNPLFEMAQTFGGLQWSPDSRYLAFTSGETGSSDVSVLDTTTQQVTPIPSGPNTATYLNWSADSTRLIFTELETYGTGGGYSMPALFQLILPEMQLANLELTTPQPDQAITLVGWLNGSTMLYSPLSMIAGASGLYQYDFATQTATELLPVSIEMTTPAWDETTQTAAFVVPQMNGLNVGLAAGAYTWTAGTAEPTLVQSGDFYFAEVARPGIFLFEGSAASSLYDLTTLTPLPASDYGALVSPGADVVILYRSDGAYISQISADDAQFMEALPQQIAAWSPDGTKVYGLSFTDEGGGLVEVDVINRTARLLDSRLMVNSPVVIVR